MNVNQAELNNQYREILNTLFGGEITLADKYLNEKSVIRHHCKGCRRTFYAKPLWLVRGKDRHNCEFSSTGKPQGQKKKGGGTPNEATQNEMILLYKKGESMNFVARKFEVSPPTVKKIFVAAGVEIRQK